MIRPPPRSPLFPSTPLSRSRLRSPRGGRPAQRLQGQGPLHRRWHMAPRQARPDEAGGRRGRGRHTERGASRSEEHTSELQSPCNLVCRLLLEKKKKTRPAPVTCTSFSRRAAKPISRVKPSVTQTSTSESRSTIPAS